LSARHRARGHADDAFALVGREPERAEITRLLEAARDSRSGVLVLRGEAGVGKSALLDFAAGSAVGMRILRVVGVEPESDLAFAALHQLLRPVLPYVDRIPRVQAEALQIAMGIAPGIGWTRAAAWAAGGTPPARADGGMVAPQRLAARERTRRSRGGSLSLSRLGWCCSAL